MHYYLGAGEAIKLSNIGHLQDVIDAAKEHVFRGIERQLFKQDRSVRNSILNNTFENTYPFYSVSFVHGRSTVEGRYYGYLTNIGNALYIDAEVQYNFNDIFTDSLDIRERNSGTSDPRAMQANEPIDSEVGRQFYDIADSWTTKKVAIIHRL